MAGKPGQGKPKAKLQLPLATSHQGRAGSPEENTAGEGQESGHNGTFLIASAVRKSSPELQTEYVCVKPWEESISVCSPLPVSLLYLHGSGCNFHAVCFTNNYQRGEMSVC